MRRKRSYLYKNRFLGQTIGVGQPKPGQSA